MPVQREIGLSVGLSAATESSLTTLLSQSNDPNDELNSDGYSSNGVGLICGGLLESKVPIPSYYKCVIAKRRGLPESHYEQVPHLYRLFHLVNPIFMSSYFEKRFKDF